MDKPNAYKIMIRYPHHFYVTPLCLTSRPVYSRVTNTAHQAEYSQRTPLRALMPTDRTEFSSRNLNFFFGYPFSSIGIPDEGVPNYQVLLLLRKSLKLQRTFFGRASIIQINWPQTPSGLSNNWDVKTYAFLSPKHLKT